MEYLYCFFPEEAIKDIDKQDNFGSSQQPNNNDDDEKDGPSGNQKNDKSRWRIKEEVYLKPEDESRLHYKTSMTIPANPETDETIYKSEVFFIPKTNDTSEYSTTLYIYPKSTETEDAFIAIDEDLVDSVAPTTIYIDVPAGKRLDEDWTWSRKMYAALAQH